MGTQGGFAAVPREPSGPASVYCLLEDREGSIWAGSDVGVVWQWQAGLWRSYGETNGLPKSNIEALAQGSDDTIWAGTRSAGVYFFREGGFHPLAARTGSLSAQEAARRLLADREDGTLWVGTADAGMSRLSRGMLSHWGTAEGLKHPSVTAVAEGSSGDWWVGTQEGGLYQLQDRRLSKCLEPAVLARFPYIYSVLATEEGGVWAAGENCLFRFRKGQPTQAYLEAPIRGEAIRALCADGTNLWMGTYYSTLLKCEGTNIHMVATNGSFGGDIRSIVREASDTLWIGSASGLYRWERGQVKTWNTGDGLLTASVQISGGDCLLLGLDYLARVAKEREEFCSMVELTRQKILPTREIEEPNNAVSRVVLKSNSIPLLPGIRPDDLVPAHRWRTPYGSTANQFT